RGALRLRGGDRHFAGPCPRVPPASARPRLWSWLDHSAVYSGNEYRYAPRAMLTPFHYAFVQRGLLEVVLLSVSAGVLGTWIVLRGLAFFSHAVATAAFPGLVLADGLGVAGPLGAFAAALVFVFGVERLSQTRRSGNDALTALVLVGSLSLGVILASDVFHSHA